MTQQSPEGAEMWDARFDRDDYLFGREPSNFVKTQAHRLATGTRMLCVAEGEGRNAVYLAGLGMQVTAFDISERGLEKARALAADAGVTVDFQHAGVMDWDWAGQSFDAIVATYIQFSPPPERARVFAGIDAALNPGGLLLLHGFAPRQIEYGTGGPPFAENMYNLGLLHSAFPDYNVLHADDYDADVNTSAAHSGMAALVDFVAMKPQGD